MAEFLSTRLSTDGERRPFADHGHAVLANAGGAALLYSRFEPGWRWSQDVAPIVGTERCREHHLGYVLSGTMHIVHEDGTEADFAGGDLLDIPAGHDAWVTSDGPCEMVDFSPDATRYAVARPKDIAAPDDPAMTLVRRGYEAFNTGDVATLRSIMAHDVLQHVAGHGRFAGTHKGIDAVLDYYGKLAESTQGTFRCDLIDVHGDGAGHVVAMHQMSATIDGVKRVSRGSIVFTFVGDKATDLLELHGDLPGDDAFFG
jgi:ketosteroid isomerase-like protein